MVSAFLVVLVLAVYIHSQEVGDIAFVDLVLHVPTHNACVCSFNVMYKLSPNL